MKSNWSVSTVTDATREAYEKQRGTITFGDRGGEGHRTSESPELVLSGRGVSKTVGGESKGDSRSGVDAGALGTSDMRQLGDIVPVPGYGLSDTWFSMIL